MSDLENFNKIRQFVGQKEYYKPRTYETLGGVWTRDTWERDNIEYNLEDEGCSRRIVYREVGKIILQVRTNYHNDVFFEYGTSELLEQLARKFSPEI